MPGPAAGGVCGLPWQLSGVVVDARSPAFTGRAVSALDRGREARRGRPGKRYTDWDLPDPKGRPIEEVRATRDEIAPRVAEVLAEL